MTVGSGRSGPGSGSTTRDRILGLLRLRERTAGELASAIGVSPQAIRDQLRTLEGAGRVEVSRLRRDTGGKPARVYALTQAGEETFEKAYGPVLAAVLEALGERLGAEERRAVLEAAGRRLAEAVGSPGSVDPDGGGEARPPVERLGEAATALNELGGAAEVVEGPPPAIRSDGCPLSGVARVSPEACRVAEALVRRLTGLEVRERCDREGRPRCRFELAEG